MKTITLIALLTTFVILTQGQTYIYEGFEAGKIPDTWKQEYVQQTEPWKCKTGVGTGTNPPTTAYNGTYNASFYKNTLSTTRTRLVTAEFDIEDAVKPELHFYYANYYYSDEFGEGNAKLSVYYRSQLNGIGWTKLKDFDDPQNAWKEGVILIPDTAHFGSIQLAFEGRIEDENQHGICLDEIKVIETGIIQKSIKSISAIQASTDLIPTGSINNPILRVKFTVSGNDGVLKLDSLGLKALLNTTAVVPSSGVKLFTTTSTKFNDTTQISTSASFNADYASFNNINYSLPIGDSYLWICYNVPVDNNHEFKGKNVDALIPAKGIKISGAYYNETEMNPSGYRSISESLFYDDFEAATHWTLTGEFQHNRPIGKGGTYGKSDPTFARSGYKVLGTDLTGLGTFKGDYEKNIGPKAYKAITDTSINAKYFKNINLEFYSWLNVYFTDSAQIDISLDGGTTFLNLWTNSGTVSENQWTFKQLSLGNLADRNDHIKFRFTAGPTSNLFPYSGWNIDNFAITGSFVESDAGVTAILSPTEGCGHVAPEDLTVTVKNFGFGATNDTMPIGYSLNNGVTWTMDTIFTPLAQEQSINYTFEPKINLTLPGEYNILVKTFLDGDEDTRNDQTDTVIYSVPTYTLPYSQNFETNSGHWRSFGTEPVFQYGKPTDSIITNAFSGTKCWATKLGGDYTNNNYSWLQSPCFDFTGIQKPIFECMLWSDAEAGADGMALYYSANGGTSYQPVPTEGSFDWEWYNESSITSLGHEGWDSIGTGWVKMRQILPASLANNANVKLRFVFKSDAQNTDAGFAIDDIKIIEAPIDAGLTAVVSPITSCYLTDSQQVTVTLKNFGIRTIKPSDVLKASMRINNELVETQNFSLASDLTAGSSVSHTFNGYYNFFNKGDYKIVAYTQVTGDNGYYLPVTYNDTVIDTVSVLGEPMFDLGPDIGTLQPDTVVLNAGLAVEDSTLYLYQWNIPDSTQPTFHLDVFGPGETEQYFYVTITHRTNNCVANDSITVMNSVYDRGISAMSGLDSTCFNNLNFNLTVDISNYSAIDSVLMGDSIAIGYQINDEPKFVEYAILPDTLFPGGTINNIVFQTQPAITSPGLYDFKVFTSKRADLDYNNDTMYTSIRVYPLPVVDIGADTIFTALADTITFDAGINRQYYQWLETAPGMAQTYDVPVKSTSKYYVEVQDTNLCTTASDTVMIIADNWRMDSIVSPANNCTLTATEQITVSITNHSPNNYSNGYQVDAYVIVNTDTVYETITLASGLAPFTSTEFTFTSPFDLSEPGTYNIKSGIMPEYDSTRTDNNIEGEIEVWGIYPVNIGEDTLITKNASSITLDAGAGYESYLWSDGSTGRTFNIPKNNSDVYAVDVTSAHGCSNSSDMVRILAYDMAVTEIINPEPRCELTNANRIRITVNNFGPDIIPSGEALKFYYNINNGAWIEKTYTTTSAIDPDESGSIIIFEDIPFKSSGTYNMKLYSKWSKDYYHENDTAYKTIYQYVSPSVNLGPDVFTTNADTLLLDAGAGNTGYLWNDDSRLQTYNVNLNQSADYSVTVSNSFGCTDADSMKVITTDIEIDEVFGLDNTCDFSKLNPVEVGVLLNGIDILPSGTIITAYYEIDGNRITQNFALPQTLNGGDTALLRFATPVNLIGPDDFTFTAGVSTANEADTNNNSANGAFRIGKYVTELGNNQVTYAPSVTLDAGAPGITDYVWSTTETSQTIVVTESDTYNVTVTDIKGCTDDDAVNIFFLRPRYDLTAISGLADSCIRINNETISLTLQNNGNDTIFADSTITVYYSVNGGSTSTQNYTFTNKFIPGNQVAIPIASPLDLSGIGSYNVLAYMLYGADSTGIDTLVNTWGLPTVDLGANMVTYNASELLDAGAGFVDFLWSTTETTQQITVTTTGTYSVTATNNHGCSDSDDKKLQFMVPLYNVTDIMGLADSCERTNNSNIAFTLTNAGNDTVFTDSTINIYYTVNGANQVTENYTFTQDFDPGQTIDINFATPADLVTIDTYTIEAWVTFGSRTSALDTTISTFGIPDITLPADSITYETTMVLDAGTGFDDYLWNNTESTQQITVSTNGNYAVTATTINGCVNSGSVNTQFMVPVYNVTNIIGLADSCYRESANSIAFTLTNAGNDTIFADSTISINYEINGANQVTEEYTFTQDFDPGNSVNIPFVTKADLTAIDNYLTEVWVTFNTTTWSMDTTVSTFGIPAIPLPTDTLTYNNLMILDAGPAFDTYEWSTTETSQQITITNSGTYSVTATTTNNCTNTSTVDVVFIQPLYNITEIVGLADSCLRNAETGISFNLINLGNDTVFVDSTISIHYQINGGAQITDDYTFTQNFEPGNSVIIPFVTTADLQAVGIYNTEVWVTFGNSTILVDTTVSTFGVPNITLPADTSTFEMTMLLDAGAGFESYLWSTDETTQQITVTETGTYSVTATTLQNCVNIGSVNVQFKMPNYQIIEITGLADSCYREGASSFAFTLQNAGSETILSDSTISINYQINGTNQVTEDYTFTQDFNPGQTVSIPFETSANLTGIDSYFTEVWITLNNVTSANDTTVSTFGIPDILIPSDTVSYEQSIMLDAGAGFETYIWSNGETTQQIAVENSGTYTVNAETADNCSNSGSTNVLLINPSYQITEIIGLADSCQRVGLSELSINLFNAGSSTILTDSIISIGYQINGLDQVTEDYTFVQDFGPGETIAITFQTLADLKPSGVYTAEVCVSMDNRNILADTTVSTFGFGALSLPTDTTSYEESVELDAGNGFISYLWSTNETSQKITVTSGGTYSVTATTANLCESFSSVSVRLIKPDYQIAEILDLADSCYRENLSKIAFRLENIGTDTIFMDSTIQISYTLNDDAPVSETHTFTSNFEPGNLVSIEFAQNANLMESNEYEIKVEALIGNIELNSDTTIRTFELPDPELGSDIAAITDTILLDAGEGFESYLWNTNETAQTIEVTENGTYWVKVTNENGCEGSDTISVSFTDYRMIITSLHAPLNGCGSIDNAEVKVTATNSGLRTIKSGSVITFGYQAIEQNPVYEQVTLAADKKPGTTLNYTFNQTINLTGTGTQVLKQMVRIDNSPTDTSEFEVIIYELPEFEFESDTIEVNGYPYEIDPDIEAESYLWSTNAITPTLTITTDGLYWLQITDANTCSFTDTVVTVLKNSITDDWSHLIQIYPNPASKSFKVLIPEPLTHVNIEALNSQGKTIFTQENAGIETPVDASDWAKGLYLIRVTHEQKVAVFQIVIQ